MISSQGDLRQSLLLRAQELFALCDQAGKGYAYREELAGLIDELPLSPEQLEVVFDALDADGDGRLTLQEFSDGFGMFLGIDSPHNYLNASVQDEENEEDDEELEELLDHLGARNLFTDEDYVREMWHRVRKDDPVMRSNFENFISKMAVDFKETVEEKESLQYTLKSREQENESRVQSLYAEMEEQMRMEKEEALAREQRKEQQLRDELETELQLKDHQLHELLEKHEQMEKQLLELNSEEAETKYENKKLQKDRDVLESRLSDSEKMLRDMKNQMNLLRQRSLEEKRKRAQAVLKVSEGIALERENLVLELQTLKEINKQLLDEKDELEQTAVQQLPPPKPPRSGNSPRVIRRSEERVNKIMNPCYVNCHSQEVKNSHAMPTDQMLPKETYQLDTAECVENSLECSNCESSLTLSCEEDDEEDNMHIQNNLNLPLEKRSNDPKHNVESSVQTSTPSLRETMPFQDKITKAKTLEDTDAPSRVFKVVFVGDSGVGKTSILQRFCNADFKPTFCATIGVDFQVKTVRVDGEKIALQLWDTAGQERFRSMTQQYFRKADGIIVVYDVTSETSFKNVRNWMHSVQEGVQNNAVILLMGNKVDLCKSEEDRVIRPKDGERMADEYGALFYETSAKTGSCIHESIESLASVLKTKEDETIEQVLKLQEMMYERRRRKCC